MALLSCKEQTQLNRSVAGVSESTATRYFVAQYDTQVDTVTAEGAPGINVGDSHPTDSDRYVKTIEGRGVDESVGYWFNIQIDYSSTVDQNPLNAPPAISWDFSESTQPYFIDYDPAGSASNADGSPGKPTLNSAGESFENLLERETGSIRATYKVNVPAGGYDPSQAVTFNNVINDGGFTIDGVSIGDGQGKCRAITGGPLQNTLVNGTRVYYREKTTTIDFRMNWNDVIDDRGFNEKDPMTMGKLRQIVKGTPPTKPDKPWPLDGSGAAKANITDTPSQLTFKPYKKMSFGALGLT